MKKLIAILVVGLLGGGAAGWFGHERLAPQLGLEGEEIEALVLDERTDDERLLLTLEAGERTLLLSFVERSEDVASLVAPGDTLLVRVPRNTPFADDPAIVEVRRAEDRAEEAADDDGSEAADPDSVDPEDGGPEEGDEAAPDSDAEPASDAAPAAADADAEAPADPEAAEPVDGVSEAPPEAAAETATT